MSSGLRVVAETPHSASVTRNSGLGIPASSAALPAEIFPRSNSFTPQRQERRASPCAGALRRVPLEGARGRAPELAAQKCL